MAKQLQRIYSFTPGIAGAGTIQIPGKVDLNQLLLITNATTNGFLYNFADPTYAGTTITFTRGNSTAFPQTVQNTDGYTTITLAVDTSSMLSSHNIQIFTERPEIITRPWAMGTDAFERTRVAAPQSMLDADFEYGLQPTKWQQIETMRGYPSIYEVPGTDQTILSITTDASGGGGNDIQSLITITTQFPHNLTVGGAVTVNNLQSTITAYARAQGNFIINSTPSPNTLTYYAKGKVGVNNGDRLDNVYTIVRKGLFYTGSSIGTSTFVTAGSGASTTGTITVTFAANHGLIPGETIITIINSDNGSNNHNLCQGSFYITSTPTPTTLTYNARNVGTITGTPIGGIYARPDAFFVHRPLDGGVMLGTGGPSHGYHAIRMSKKYIRYQSGKAVNYNTAALFAPNYDLRALTATNTTVGSTIYITMDDVDHGLQAGAGILVSGAITSGYNGYYAVNSVIDERNITVISTSTLGSTSAAFAAPATLQHISWHGSTIRSGTFDDQNGMYWQFDGIQMAIGQRSSTFQTAGTVNVVPDSNLVTGNSSRFDSQMAAGDRVVIKGMTHVITAISSATWMYVNPDYRGTTASGGVKMVKVTDKVVPQSQWNVDRCDGTNGPFNPSGYYLQPNRLQMIGLQWTWYGAGFIDWMLRGPDGNYMTVHRMKNSNINTEAYMRSGNQPVRYEVQNEGARSTLNTDLSTVGTVMTVTDITYFPSTGTVYIDNELINFSGKTGTTGIGQLTGLTRTGNLTYFAGGATRTFTATNIAQTHATGVGVVLISQTSSPSISHWGSAFLTDGGFDQDRGYIFNYQANNITISTKKSTAFAIRLAPSVSNAVTGDLGVRDLINRAQLLLQGLENTAGGSTQTNQAIVIEGVLNPSNFPSNPASITWYNLQGSVSGGNLLGSGQPSFTQISPGSYINFDGTATYTTTAAQTIAAGSVNIQVNSTATMQVGDAVVSPATTFVSIPGNTLISSIGNGVISITNPLVGTLPSGSTLNFYRNQWAVPGETIFSTVSNPGSKDILDLSPLKELTNTPLGGRGTYPNGPDTLFINVYLTQGNPILTNLVLRWGEAQA
jgi:hypothetical protein